MCRSSQISVSSEPSLQIVRSHFQQISGSQWVMLSRGMCDLETMRILTSMIISLVQKLSANVLGLIIPRREVNNRILNRSKSSRAHGTIITVLQNTMGQVFSQALNLPTDSMDKHQDSQELTTLIEQEVSTKVNRVLSEVQEEGPLIVDALISSESVARSMIDKGKSCLMRGLRHLFCSCGRRAATNKSESSENVSCRCSFLRFAKKNFRSMQENLEAELLVEELEPETRSLSRGSSWGSYPDLEKTPGYALRSPEVSFEQFQPEVEVMFQQLDLSTSPDTKTSQERLAQVLDREQTTAFAQKLTDTMYCHFQILNRFALAASPNTEIRSEFQNQDPEQTNTEKTMVKCKLRHNDLKRTYATVQSEVSNYLQSLQNYTTQDPLENFYRQDLFELCLEKPPLSPNSQQTLTYNVSIPSQGSVPVQVDFEQLPGQSFNSQKHDLFERSLVSPKVEQPSFNSQDVPAVVLKTPEDMRRISDRDLSEGQSMTRGLIEALMVKMFRGKTALRLWDENYKVIRDRLTEVALEEIQLSENQAKKMEERMNKIVAAILEDLISHYGTAQRMVESALDEEDETFDKTVLKSLQYHLEHNLRKKRSFLSRMFRCEPFQCCCCCCCCCCCPNIDD